LEKGDFMAKPKNRKRFQTTIDEKLLNKAKHLAVDQNKGLNDILEEALELLFKTLKESCKN
jgi:hypothetical protein